MTKEVTIPEKTEEALELLETEPRKDFKDFSASIFILPLCVLPIEGMIDVLTLPLKIRMIRLITMSIFYLALMVLIFSTAAACDRYLEINPRVLLDDPMLFYVVHFLCLGVVVLYFIPKMNSKRKVSLFALLDYIVEPMAWSVLAMMIVFFCKLFVEVLSLRECN